MARTAALIPFTDLSLLRCRFTVAPGEGEVVAEYEGRIFALVGAQVLISVLEG